MPRLPDALDAFVGRDRELTDIAALLRRRTTRLLTLTGAGGAGKTRLALEHARQHATGAIPVLVELAGLADDADPTQAVATALGVTERDRHTGADALAHSIGGHRVLLLLDNCEHIVDRCARLIAYLLERCPGLRVLATSREALRIPGEVILRISALDTDPCEGVSSGRRQAHAGTAPDAVQLFTDRATASSPGLHLTGEDTATATEICRRLDGMPLAIELAARRTASMPLKAVLAGLDDQLALLTGGSRTGPARHVDLATTIDWSHRLLGEPEKALLRRVSVLRGGFDAAAAAAVAADGPDGVLPARRILPFLLDLEAKSLITRTTTTNPSKPRFRQLEAVRAYAEEQLEASGERSEVQRRAVAWLSELVAPLTDSVYPDLTVGPALAEQDNLAAAVATASGPDGTTPGGPPPVLVFALAEVRCHQEQVSAARALLEAGPDWPDRRLHAARLALTATLSLMQGDTELGLQFSEQAVRLAHALQDPVQLAKGLEARARARLTKGEYPQAVEDKRACAATLATLNRPLETAAARHNVAWALLQADRPGEADAILADCLPVLREQAPPLALGCVLHTAGAVRLACEDWPAARGLFAEALRAMPAEGYPGYVLIEGLAAAAAAQGEHRRAVRLFTAATRIQTQQEIEPEPCWRDQLAPFRSAAAAALPRTTRSAAQASARTLSWTQLVAYALGATVHKPAQSSTTGPLGPLTGRERQVAELVAEGLTNQQIGDKLKVAPSTIATHLNRIRDKLNLRTRIQITQWLTTQHTAQNPTAA